MSHPDWRSTGEELFRKLELPKETNHLPLGCLEGRPIQAKKSLLSTLVECECEPRSCRVAHPDWRSTKECPIPIGAALKQSYWVDDLVL